MTDYRQNAARPEQPGGNLRTVVIGLLAVAVVVILAVWWFWPEDSGVVETGAPGAETTQVPTSAPGTREESTLEPASAAQPAAPAP